MSVSSFASLHCTMANKNSQYILFRRIKAAGRGGMAEWQVGVAGFSLRRCPKPQKLSHTFVFRIGQSCRLKPATPRQLSVFPRFPIGFSCLTGSS